MTTTPNDATEQGPKGLVCRACGCRHFYVVYTRPSPRGILRRRECRHCGARKTTFERDAGAGR